MKKIQFYNQIYQHRILAEEKSADDDAQEEEILEKIQDGGDVAGDLRVLFWDTPDALEELLIKTMISDMAKETGGNFDRNDRMPSGMPIIVFLKKQVPLNEARLFPHIVENYLALIT